MEPFFTIHSKEIQEGQLNFNIALNPNHPVYKGHFPEKPVAPGVMLAQMVKNLLETTYDRELKMTGARNIKFMNMMLPENASDVDVEIKVKEVENQISINAKASIEEAVYFKISASFV